MDFAPYFNGMVAVAFVLLAFCAVVLAVTAQSLVSQANRTLFAYEKLAETLDTELTPTLAEVKNVLEGVNQIRSVTTQRVTEVSHQVEDVAGSVSHAADEAKKHSSVWGAGLLAGVRAYMAAKDHKSPEQGNKQITENRGEKNVEIN